MYKYKPIHFVAYTAVRYTFILEAFVGFAPPLIMRNTQVSEFDDMRNRYIES